MDQNVWTQPATRSSGRIVVPLDFKATTFSVLENNALSV